MRLTYFTCTLALLLACGPGTGNTESTGSTTPGTTGTTGTPGTATDPTTGTTTTDPTVTDATGDSVTEVTFGSTLIATTMAGDTGDTSDTATSDPTTGTTGTTGDPNNTCVVDADCALHSDCCTCEGVRFDVDVPSCDERCKQTLCSAFGIDAAVCRLGVCETERVRCDQSKVACDQLPPPCPEGQLAETDGVCYTGDCVPARFCDVVTDCADCPADMMCVQKVAFTVESITCEPIPPGCGGIVDCDCVADLVCTDDFQGCFEQGGAVVSCECLNC
jgi:hypothetical protein